MKFLSIISLTILTAISCTTNPITPAEMPIPVSLFSSDVESGIACYRIPALTTAPNGDLIAAIDERVQSCGDIKINKDINIVIRRSSDNGQTWAPIEKVIDYPFGQSASDPSFIVDNTAKIIFMFFNYIDSDMEKDVFYFKVTKSTDNGKTWSEPVDITSQITKSDWQSDFKFITSGNGIQTRNGKLLHTIVNLQKGLFVFGSDNHGDDWYLLDKSISPADESKIVELNNNILMINSRVNGAGNRYVHTSADNGISWNTTPEPALPDPGCNASIIRYSSTEDGDDKDRLIFSNANNSDARNNMTIRISYDEGKTWSAGKSIYVGSSAYSSLTILKNGDIGLFFERNNYKDNVFVALSIDWLTYGKDKIK